VKFIGVFAVRQAIRPFGHIGLTKLAEKVLEDKSNDMLIL
jgi:hypothetical protein